MKAVKSGARMPSDVARASSAQRTSSRRSSSSEPCRKLRAKPERSGWSRPPPPESSASDRKEPSRERQEGVARGGFGGMLAREARGVDGLVAPEQPAGVRVGADPVGQEPEIPFDDLERRGVVLKPVRSRVLGEDEVPAGREALADRTQEPLGIGDVVQEVVGEHEVPRSLGERVPLRIDPPVGDRSRARRAAPLSRRSPPRRRPGRSRGSRRCPPGGRARARGNRFRSRGRASGRRCGAGAPRGRGRASRRPGFPSPCGSGGAAARPKEPRTASRDGSREPSRRRRRSATRAARIARVMPEIAAPRTKPGGE